MNLFGFSMRMTSALLLVFVFWSCQEKVSLDLPEGEKFLVVEGWITNEAGPHTVTLTYTSPYFDPSAPPAVTGATVVLRDDENSIYTLTEIQPGVYLYPDSGAVGRSYQLEISLPNGDHYLSDFEELYEPVPILDMYYRITDDIPDFDDDHDPDDIYEVLIYTVEPAGPGDHYRWQTIRNGEFLREPLDLFIVNDDLVDGNEIPDFDFSGILYAEGDTVTVIQERITKAAHDFLVAVRTQTAFVGTPFDTPPAPIEGNVRNLTHPARPALGFFGASGRVRATLVVGE